MHHRVAASRNPEHPLDPLWISRHTYEEQAEVVVLLIHPRRRVQRQRWIEDRKVVRPGQRFATLGFP